MFTYTFLLKLPRKIKVNQICIYFALRERLVNDDLNFVSLFKNRLVNEEYF